MESYMCFNMPLHMHMYAYIYHADTESQRPMVLPLPNESKYMTPLSRGKKGALITAWHNGEKQHYWILANSPLPMGLMESVPLWIYSLCLRKFRKGLSDIDLSEASWQHLGSTIQFCRIMFKGQL